MRSVTHTGLFVLGFGAMSIIKNSRLVEGVLFTALVQISTVAFADSVAATGQQLVVMQDALHAERRARVSRDAGLQRSINAISLMPGPAGAVGPAGTASIVPGPKGERGEQGKAGADSMVAGPQGIQGRPGKVGQQGFPGVNGVDSQVPGPEGPQGEKGLTGMDGRDAELPVGATAGDILYWDGSVWKLSPAPPEGLEGKAGLVLISGVPTWTLPVAPVTYSVGDAGPAGGIVFSVGDDGLHGLEAAPVDLQGEASWGCYSNHLPGNYAVEINAGAQNTGNIIAACTDAGYAAKRANNYWLNGYNDWFLPSKDELDLMYKHIALEGDFSELPYWSSTQSGRFTAWSQYFTDGSQDTERKYLPQQVRTIRMF